MLKFFQISLKRKGLLEYRIVSLRLPHFLICAKSDTLSV